MSTFLSRAPLAALSKESRKVLESFLNLPQYKPTESGFFKDWRGLLQICCLDDEPFSAIAKNPSPCDYVLSLIEERSTNFTLQNLKDVLEKLGRRDILINCESLLMDDTQSYVLETLNESNDTVIVNDLEADAEVLTLDDQARIERGEEVQRYDAFLLYAEEDSKFARDIIYHLERVNNLKLCVKDRDLVAGFTFEHTAIMKLITERCNRLIIVISPEFLESAENKFFINFAQAVGVNKIHDRKIIPCIYKNCALPPQLTCFSKIHYRSIAPEFFWGNLLYSIKADIDLRKPQKSAPISIIKRNMVSDQENQFVSNESVKNEEVIDTDSVTLRENQMNRSFISFNSIRHMAMCSWKRRRSSRQETTATESIPMVPILHRSDSPTHPTSTANVTNENQIKEPLVIGSMRELLAKDV